MTNQDQVELIRQAIAGELQTTVTEAIQTAVAQTGQVPQEGNASINVPEPAPASPPSAPEIPGLPQKRSSLVNSFESTPTGLNPTGGRTTGPLTSYKKGGPKNPPTYNPYAYEDLSMPSDNTATRNLTGPLQEINWQKLEDEEASGDQEEQALYQEMEEIKSSNEEKINLNELINPDGTLKEVDPHEFVPPMATGAVTPDNTLASFFMPVGKTINLLGKGVSGLSRKVAPKLVTRLAKYVDDIAPFKTTSRVTAAPGTRHAVAAEKEAIKNLGKSPVSDKAAGKWVHTTKNTKQVEELAPRQLFYGNKYGAGAEDLSVTYSKLYPWQNPAKNLANSPAKHLSMDVGEGLLFKKPITTKTNIIKANPKASVKFMDKRLDSHKRFLTGKTLKEQQQALGEFQNIMTDPYSNPHLYMALDKSNRAVSTSGWNPTFNKNFYSNIGDKVVKTKIAADELMFGGLRYENGGTKSIKYKDEKKNKGVNIKVLQDFLIRKGYDLGAGKGKPITRGVGVFGPKTKAALESYNRKQNLREVGEHLTGIEPFAGFPMPVRELMKSSLLPGFMYKMTGDFSDADMNKRQLDALAQTVDDALKRGKTQISYSEKDDEGNIKPHVHAWDKKGYKDLGNTSTWADLLQMFYNPTYNNKTTFGTTDIIETPEYIDSKGNVVPSQRWIEDEYDFNDAEKAQRKNTFIDKWKDILGAKSPYSIVRAFARNYSNPKGRDMMVRVKKKGGLR